LGHCAGYVCVRAFDQRTRRPRLLAARLHQSGAKIVAGRTLAKRGRRATKAWMTRLWIVDLIQRLLYCAGIVCRGCTINATSSNALKETFGVWLQCIQVLCLCWRIINTGCSKPLTSEGFPFLECAQVEQRMVPAVGHLLKVRLCTKMCRARWLQYFVYLSRH
jgi:hypothetical protein